MTERASQKVEPSNYYHQSKEILIRRTGAQDVKLNDQVKVLGKNFFISLDDETAERPILVSR